MPWRKANMETLNSCVTDPNMKMVKVCHKSIIYSIISYLCLLVIICYEYMKSNIFFFSQDGHRNLDQSSIIFICTKWISMQIPIQVTRISRSWNLQRCRQSSEWNIFSIQCLHNMFHVFAVPGALAHGKPTTT